ncbi:MAG: BrnT family toxin [Acidobacteriota bacterium]
MSVRYTLHEIEFEWDARKAESNLRKHGVGFEEACEVFFDPFLYALEDVGEKGEAREAVMGMMTDWRLIYVVYVERENSIRIISARSATKQERWQYENQ